MQSDFDFDDGVALLNSAPFTGLAFETDEACGLIDVHFLSGTIACKAIAGWKSYSNGKAGGKLKPGSLEEKYGPVRLLTLDSFPDEAQNFDAALDDGGPLNGIVYEQSGGEWEARMYVAGHQDLQLFWAENGTLVHALCYGPIREVLQWYENGAWKECRISRNDAPGTALRIALQANGRVTFLAIRN